MFYIIGAVVVSPNASNGYNVRYVNPSGTVNNNNAYNGYGASLDCDKKKKKLV